MYRVHRLGHIEAKTIELPLSERGLRKARQAYMYLTLGFEMEVEKSLGISIDGAERIELLPPDPERPDETRILMIGDRR